MLVQVGSSGILSCKTPVSSGVRIWLFKFSSREEREAPLQIVHAYNVPHLYAQAVFLKAAEHVAVEKLAGKYVLLKPVGPFKGFLGPLGVSVVHAVQEVGDPGQLHLHRPYL